jgi:hypothetical protein
MNERGACSLGPSELPVGAFSKEFKRPIEELLWGRCAGGSNCSSDTSYEPDTREESRAMTTTVICQI